MPFSSIGDTFEERQLDTAQLGLWLTLLPRGSSICIFGVSFSFRRR